MNCTHFVPVAMEGLEDAVSTTDSQKCGSAAESSLDMMSREATIEYVSVELVASELNATVENQTYSIMMEIFGDTDNSHSEVS